MPQVRLKLGSLNPVARLNRVELQLAPLLPISHDQEQTEPSPCPPVQSTSSSFAYWSEREQQSIDIPFHSDDLDDLLNLGTSVPRRNYDLTQCYLLCDKCWLFRLLLLTMMKPSTCIPTAHLQRMVIIREPPGPLSCSHMASRLFRIDLQILS